MIDTQFTIKEYYDGEIREEGYTTSIIPQGRIITANEFEAVILDSIGHTVYKVEGDNISDLLTLLIEHGSDRFQVEAGILENIEVPKPITPFGELIQEHLNEQGSNEG